MRPVRRAWTPNDDALLRRLIRRRSSKEMMALLLDRSVTAVYVRISKLRLKDHDRTDRRRICFEPKGPVLTP